MALIATFAVFATSKIGSVAGVTGSYGVVKVGTMGDAMLVFGVGIFVYLPPSVVAAITASPFARARSSFKVGTVATVTSAYRALKLGAVHFVAF